MIGKTFSHYKILEQLGKGGMGEVYLADDTTLDRKVALKFLPEAFTSDPERMARFEREAKLLASLNHPNIAGIYGLEQAEGNRFLVLEYVEGETLQARLSKGALPLEDALVLCRQIAEGLEAAHEKGVIHRDLKPANVMITAEEKVKILDFGLAKAFSDETQNINSSQSPTLTEAMTQPGVILGTAAYMSPEQAKGKSVDKRADIWAFGCILYECLTGKKAFEGETVTETLAAILRGEPDWNVLPSATPQNIHIVLRRCLEKEKNRRFRNAADIQIVVDEMRDVGSAAIHKSFHKQPIVWVLSLIAIAAIVFAFWNRSTSTPKEVVRLSIPLPPGEEITEPPAISPDGQTIAYVSWKGMDEPQLYLRDLNSFESRLVTKSSGAEQPFFSPDGRWVAYYAKGKLQKSEVAGGGNPIMLCNTTSFIGGTWCEDHTIIYSTGGSGLLRISEDGGKPESLTAVNEADQGYAHALPQSLPGSHNVLFTIWGGESTGNALLSLDSLSWEPIRPGTFGIFAASSGSKGYLLSGDLDGGIKAAAFDPARPGLKGIETSVLSDVYFVPDLTKSWLAVSGNGTAVYAKGNTNKKSLVWVYRNGKIEPFFTEQADYNSVAIAPDGSSVLIEQSVLKRYLYIYDLKRPGTRKRLTLQGETGSLNKQPIWSHDASHIFFSSPRGGDWDIYSQPVNSFLSPELSLERPNAQYPYSVANDGTLFFTEYHPKTGGDIWKLTPEAKVESVRVTPFNEYGPVVSPNRKWIAYVSDESSQSEVYILDYPEMKETPNPVSSGGGGMPKWSRDGSELFYRTSDAMMAVTIGPDGSITSEPRRLFDAKDYGYYYDISSDGKRFLMIRRDPGSVPNQLNVILNWTEELKEKVPVP